MGCTMDEETGLSLERARRLSTSTATLETIILFFWKDLLELKESLVQSRAFVNLNNTYLYEK